MTVDRYYCMKAAGCKYNAERNTAWRLVRATRSVLAGGPFFRGLVACLMAFLFCARSLFIAIYLFRGNLNRRDKI